MRHCNRFLWIIVSVMVLVTGFVAAGKISQPQSGTVSAAVPAAENNKSEYRACWISYIDIQQYLKGKSEVSFRAKVNEMYDNMKAQGLNTVIVHARAMGDTFYESEYFPYSEYLSADRKALSYDPYKLLVDIAHEKGLRFEAWINPYRISIGDETTEQFMESGYYSRYQSMILSYTGTNGTCMSLDPASESARKLILDSLEELVSKYAVDGIHFDDYFYVDGMQASLSEQQKKENVNILVRQVCQFAKSQEPVLTFGISPAGNPDYARSQGADIDTWLSTEGYVDYVMPQIYWTDRYVVDGAEVPMFSERCEAWIKLRTNPKIKLYVGLALYRVGEASDTDLDWACREDNLAAQCAQSYGMGYAGFALFRYAYLEETHTQTELENLSAYLKKQIGVLTAQVDAGIVYTARMQSYGWQEAKTDGVVAGSPREENAVEAVRVQLGNDAPIGHVRYAITSTQGQEGWCMDGEQAGGVGETASVLGIRINVTGDIATCYDISYRVYILEKGWTAWEKNGSYAGGGLVQALQVKLVKKLE